MPFFLVSLAVALASAAEPKLPDPLAPDAFAAAVLALNPELDAARAAIEAAAARRAAASALPETTLSASFAPSMLGHEPAGYQVSLNQMLPAPGARPAARAVAEAELRASGADLEATRARLTAEATRALVDGWQAERTISAITEQRARMRALLDAAQGRLAAGVGMADEPWMIEAELARMDAELAMLQADREGAARRMNALLHRAPDAPLPPLELPATLPPRSLAPPPTIAAAQARAEQAEAEIALMKAMSRPMPGLMVEHGTLMSGEPMTVIGAELRLPWGGDARRAEAQAMAAMAAADAAAMADEIAAMASEADAGVQAAEARMLILEGRLLPLAERRLEAANAGLAAGTGSLDRALAASSALTQAQLEVTEARAALWRMGADRAAALGVASVLVGGAP